MFTSRPTAAGSHGEPWSDSEEAPRSQIDALIAERQADIDALADQWASHKPGATSVAKLRGQIHEALQAAQSRWTRNKRNFDREAPRILAAVLESKRNEMLFSIAGFERLRSLGKFAPPASGTRLVSDPIVGDSDKYPVAVEVVRLMQALEKRHPGVRADTYGPHGGGPFFRRGYSIDLWLEGRTKEGFFDPGQTIKLLTALDAVAKEQRLRWRVLYNDYRVAAAINKATGTYHVAYMGTVFRDRNRRPYNINWHGPDPLICHLHLDIVPETQTSLVQTVSGLLGAVPKAIGSAVTAGSEALLLSSLIGKGERDESRLATELFYARHPERQRRKLDPKETQGVAEWRAIRDRVVRPALARASAQTEQEEPSGAGGFFSEALKRVQEGALLSSLIARGERDPGKLTTEVFYARHPGRNRRPLDPSEQQGKAEWLAIRDQQVRPLLARLSVTFAVGGWGGWKGLSSAGSGRVSRDLATDPYSIAVAATSTLEGFFDKVQTYDQGILSWGIKQWTLHKGSLQRVLGFMQRQLTSTGKGELWQALFPGIDIRDGNVLYVNGKRHESLPDLMRWIRNGTDKVEFDRPHMEKWMRMFVLAGRDPTIQSLQMKVATDELRQVLETRPKAEASTLPFPDMNDAKPIGHYLQGNTRALAFFQSMYTQNPSWAKALVGRTVRKLRKDLGPEPSWSSTWGQRFLAEYEKAFRESGVACWGTAALKSKKACAGRQSRYAKTLAGLQHYAPGA